jgi:alpha-galactosidase
VTFPNVTVSADGIYQLEIDYQTQGLRSLFVGINGGATTELDVHGTTFSEPTVTSIPVQLHAGTNSIVLNNPNGPAPDIDRIVVAPTLASATLKGELTGKVSLAGQQLWLFKISNVGLGIASSGRLNSISFTQTSGNTCSPKAELPLPLPLGDIDPGSSRTTLVPVNLSTCRAGAHFTTSVTYSANNGAAVGTSTGTDSR